MITRRQAVVAGISLSSTRIHAVDAGDWKVAAPESQGLDAGVVTEVLRAGESLPGLRGIAVARHGVLVADRYYAGTRDTSLLAINSATKSVTSMLVGIALTQGRLSSLDRTVAELVPEAVAEVPDSPAAALTLRQILTGRTGLAFDPMRYQELATAGSPVRYALSRPAVPVAPPGWSYNDAMVSLLAPIIHKATGADLSTLAERYIFKPLAIGSSQWARDTDNQPLAYAGLALRTRDMLKLAALMAAGGRWNGTQVLSEAWVNQSLTPQTPATWRVGLVEDVGYGMLWFTGRLHGRRVAWAWGYGGQFSLLAADLNLAVATAATSPHPAAFRQQTDDVMNLVGRIVQAAV